MHEKNIKDGLTLQSLSDQSKNLTQEIRKIYLEAKWLKDSENYDWIEKILSSSFCFVGAFIDGKLVGIGRAISDGHSDAYIQDVAVLPSFRKRGIATEIVKYLIANLKNNGIDWIGLIAEEGAENLYINMGFKKMEKCTPMILTGENRENT